MECHSEAEPVKQCDPEPRACRPQKDLAYDSENRISVVPLKDGKGSRR